MVDSLVAFLWANLTPYGTFRAYWDSRDTLEDNNVFISLLFLDAVRPHLNDYPQLRPLADTVLRSLLRYRPPGDMWRYWVDKPIAPDFDDISIAGVVLSAYGLGFDTSTVMDTIGKYRDTARSCVVMFKDELSLRNRRCDCVVNVNVLRFTRDTSICPFIRSCLRDPRSYTYLQPKGFMLYFLSKAHREGITCGINLEEEIRTFLLKGNKGMDAILGFAAASNVGLKGTKVDKVYRMLLSPLKEGGKLPTMTYFSYNTLWHKQDSSKKIVFFFGRTLPTVLFLDGILKYRKERP